MSTFHDSIIRLDKSQRRLFDDHSRVILTLFHRQKGKDFTAAAKAVNEGLQGGQDWWIVGMTQAQADETFLKVKKVVHAMKELLKRKFGTDVCREEDEHFVDYSKEINHLFPSTNRILHLPNGVRICSLPGRDPDGLAGRTGNLILTEFGLYPYGGYKHWDVLYPIVTKNGSYFIMITTPRGKNTKAYELFQNADGFYSVHKCDIYQSVHGDGYQLFAPRQIPGTYQDELGRWAFYQRTRDEQDYAIATFRRIYASESKWAREYECQFTGDLSSLIPWNQLERAAQLGIDLPFDYLHVENSGAPIGDVWAIMKAAASNGIKVEVGYDVARSAAGDLSAVPINFCRANAPKHLRFLVTMRGVPFDEMRAFVKAGMDLPPGGNSVGAGDATGLGRESNEVLEKLYVNRWIPFMFTSSGKREIASSLATAFTDGTQTLPPFGGAAGDKHKFIATDLYALQKDDTGAQLVLEETPNVLLPASHCDIAWALGLARVAGARMAMPVHELNANNVIQVSRNTNRAAREIRGGCLV